MNTYTHTQGAIRIAEIDIQCWRRRGRRLVALSTHFVWGVRARLCASDMRLPPEGNHISQTHIALTLSHSHVEPFMSTLVRAASLRINSISASDRCAHHYSDRWQVARPNYCHARRRPFCVISLACRRGIYGLFTSSQRRLRVLCFWLSIACDLQDVGVCVLAIRIVVVVGIADVNVMNNLSGPVVALQLRFLLRLHRANLQRFQTPSH